jgi:hypothetical protein
MAASEKAALQISSCNGGKVPKADPQTMKLRGNLRPTTDAQKFVMGRKTTQNKLCRIYGLVNRQRFNRQGAFNVTPLSPPSINYYFCSWVTGVCGIRGVTPLPNDKTHD